MSDLNKVIEETLADRELKYTSPGAGRYFVTLPGTKKLQTNVWLRVNPHALVIEAFVCRRPDEAFEDVYRFMLRRNAKLYGVAYTIDQLGDIYLVGRVAHESVTPDELDRLLGQVLEAADGDFNTLLEIGFASSIQREYEWRVARGESLANLKAFEHMLTPSTAATPEV
ncbi:type III secretion system chaperone family protein [Actinophytocola sp. KF-1]